MEDQTIKLLCRMERERSLQKLIDLGFSLLGNPMFYQDVSMNIPYYTQCIEISNPFWQKHVVNGILSTESIMPHLGHDDMLPLFLKHRAPIVLDPNPYHGDNRDNMAYPMTTGNTFHGVLILASICREITEEDRMLFQLFSEIFCTKLQHNLSLGITGNTLTEQSLIRLLDGEELSPGYLEKRMKILNWHPLPYLHVATLFARENAGDSDALNHIIDRLALSSCNKLVRYRSCLVYIYSSNDENYDPEQENPELLQALSENNFCIAISRPFRELNQLRRHWEQSQQAHSIGQILFPAQTIYRFSDLAYYASVAAWADHHPIEDLLSESLLRVWAKDQQGAQLLSTLRAYLDCGNDVALCAQYLFVHKNTVRYRIQQCERLLGHSLDQGERLFQLQCGLRVIEYLTCSGQGHLLENFHTSPIPTIP